VIGLPKIHIEHDGFFRVFSLGKNVKGSFLSSDSISKGIFDLIHTDVCGPMIIASLCCRKISLWTGRSPLRT
jgi:hypothetical protein